MRQPFKCCAIRMGQPITSSVRDASIRRRSCKSKQQSLLFDSHQGIFFVDRKKLSNRVQILQVRSLFFGTVWVPIVCFHCFNIAKEHPMEKKYEKVKKKMHHSFVISIFNCHLDSKFRQCVDLTAVYIQLRKSIIIIIKRLQSAYWVRVNHAFNCYHFRDFNASNRLFVSLALGQTNLRANTLILFPIGVVLQFEEGEKYLLLRACKDVTPLPSFECCVVSLVLGGELRKSSFS